MIKSNFLKSHLFPTRNKKDLSLKFLNFIIFFKKSVFLFFPVISMSSKNGTTRFLKEGTIPYQKNEDDASNWLYLPLMILYDNIFYI